MLIDRDSDDDNFDDNNLSNDRGENNDRALNLNFTLGFSSNMIGAVHNLTLRVFKEDNSGTKKLITPKTVFINYLKP